MRLVVTIANSGKGAGLCLSVSFGIIKDYGGKILALSPVAKDYLPVEFLACDHSGPGAVFVVELPLQIVKKAKSTEKKDSTHLNCTFP